MTDTELEVLSRTMLRAWSGEPLPDVASADYDELRAALEKLFEGCQPADMQVLGAAAARALFNYWQLGLQAQRATALAEMRARGMH